MILRRITEHVRTQNWIAIGLDFVIVVVGVFLGIQLGNWNQAQSDRRDYEDALARYRTELATNLATLDTAESEVSRALTRVGRGIDALLTCDNSEEATILIEDTLRGAMGTYGLKLRDRALKTLIETPRLAAQQSPQEREAFNETLYILDVFLREADFLEVIPLQERLQNNPIIQLGSSSKRSVTYLGQDYSRPERSLELAVPISEACKDNDLIKSLYTWERWQSALPAVIRLMRNHLQDDLALLEQIGPTPDASED
ncbi:MAG: hypothetical protein AAFY84_00880 [Pseudomonadota bacterium]